MLGDWGDGRQEGLVTDEGPSGMTSRWWWGVEDSGRKRARQAELDVSPSFPTRVVHSSFFRCHHTVTVSLWDASLLFTHRGC